MSKKLFIAEKPSLGREIASAMGGGQSRQGYIEGNGWVVTYVFGHVYSLVSASDYDEKYKFWSMDNLPILPREMKLKPNPEAKKQISIIKKLIHDPSITSVVHCGDAGREGQLLIDEVLIELKNTKPVERLWLNKMTESGIQESIRNMKNNDEYKGLSDASFCRRDFDWVVGYNFSPLFTLVAKALGKSTGTQNVGRVMTPTLSLVVKRDQEIENFVPKDFYEVMADLREGFSAKWQTPEEMLDPSGYLTDKSIAERIVQEVTKSPVGIVEEAEYKKQSSSAPMPFTLIELQKQCNRLFGWTAKKTLGIAQSLYEKHKMTTYPRTDSPYLAEEQRETSRPTLEKALQLLGKTSLLKGADFTRKHPVFNDKKLGEHHAIIPTGESANGIDALTDDERKAFDLITRQFLAVFYPPKITNKLSVSLNIAGHKFKASLSEVVDFGWEYIVKENIPNQKPLPDLSVGQEIRVDECHMESKKTSPPARFNESTLLAAMENAGRYVDNKEDREILKEIEGLGTSATRSEIIDKLCSKKLGFLQRKGKNIISTEKGRKNIEVVIESVTSPELTAQWEKRLKGIEKGEISKEKFLEAMRAWISQIVEHFKTTVDFSGINNNASRGPSEKQLALAQKIANEKGLTLSEKEMSSGYECSKFIDKHIKSSKPRPPTEKQIAFAEKLAKEKNKKITKKVRESSFECSKFIDACLKNRT